LVYIQNRVMWPKYWTVFFTFFMKILSIYTASPTLIDPNSMTKTYSTLSQYYNIVEVQRTVRSLKNRTALKVCSVWVWKSNQIKNKKFKILLLKTKNVPGVNILHFHSVYYHIIIPIFYTSLLFLMCRVLRYWLSLFLIL